MAKATYMKPYTKRIVRRFTGGSANILLAALLMLTAILSGTLAGCSSGSTDSSTVNCVVIYARRMNSAASPELAQSEIVSVIKTRGYLDIVRADGSPASATNGGASMGSDSENESNRSYEQQQQLTNALAILDDVTACTDEVDMAAAMEYANRSLAKTTTGRNIVVICDSGVSTKGIIDFTVQGMLDAQPDAFVRYLKSNGLLPNLSHIDKVIWYSFGDVNGTQSGVPQSVKENMEALYKAYLEAAGVSEVVFKDDIGTASGRVTQALPSVTAVAMPQTTSFAGAGSTVKLTQAVLSFKGDSDEFIDEQSAKAVLSEYATALIASPSMKATVVGYTASYPSDSQWPITLSTMRAQRVQDTLCSLGVAADQITAIGGGVGPVADLDGNGLQIESLSAQNRYVQITFEQ